MKKIFTVAQSEAHIAKVNKWLALTPIKRLAILKEVNAKRGKDYKTLEAALGACLKFV